MVLYFIRKVHVFLQFSEKEYALLINFFSHTKGTILLFIKILARPNILTHCHCDF